MATDKKRILLAYGEGGFSYKIKDRLNQKGYVAAVLKEGDPPKATYDIIVQLGRDPEDVAERTRDLLEKAKKEDARFFLITFKSEERLYKEAISFAKSLAREFEKKKNVPTVILNLVRLYGSETLDEDSGPLFHLIREFSQEDYLTLYGKGEDSNYYLFVEDAVEGIAQAIEEAKEGKEYAISPSSPVSSETIAKLLFDLGGGRHEIRHHRGLTALEEKGKVEGEPLAGFKLQTPLREGILEILKEHPQMSKEESSLPKLRLPLIRLNFKLKIPSKKTLIWAGLVLLVLSPLLYIGAEAGSAYYRIKKAQSALSSLNFTEAQAQSQKAQSSFSRLSYLLPFAKSGEHALKAVSEVASQGEVLNQVVENLSRSYAGEDSNPQSSKEFENLSRALKSAEDELLLSWLAINQAGNPWRRYLSPAEEAVEEALKAVRIAYPLASRGWDLLGYQGERTYLILFQNSAEARSGGGFLGSLASLTLKDGGVESLDFFDSYQFDSQGKITSHPALKEFRGIKEYALREANFPASFPEGAGDIAGIFENAQGVEVDGVLGMTLLFAQDVLETAGEVNLPSFETTVNAQNLFEVTTSQVEKDFFPGSTKKKRFMQALGEGLLEKIFSASKRQWGAMAQTAWESLEQRNLLLHFEEAEIAQAFWEAGFDGRVKEAEGDYLYIIDTSYATKINEVWLSRSLNYKVQNTSREGILQGTLSVTWDHEGTESWPSGTYTNIFRALVPKGSKLKQATLEEKDYTSKVLTTQEAEKTEFSAYILVEPGEEKTLKLVYTLPLNVDEQNQYTLLVQKQPGTSGDSFTLEFEEPFGKEATAQSPSGGWQRQGEALLLKTVLEKDLPVQIKLGQE